MIPSAIIERLYGVMSRYRLRPDMDGCPHCVDDQMKESLVGSPLRELSCQELREYGFKAMTTWGDASDYKHFLPRILELAATPEGQVHLGFDLDLIARKVKDAGWEEWAPGERAAVIAYFESALDCATSSGEDSGWYADQTSDALARLR
jgi:hypothetical protein